MISNRALFLSNLAQTSSSPLLLEVSRASGSYIFDNNNLAYLDLISGISVSNVGHCHPQVVNAIKLQAEKYMHLMVYGEYIQEPQVELSRAILSELPQSLNNIYLVNSGSEAVEGAIKLARKYTGRTEFVSFKNAYHGSTLGALSANGNVDYKTSFQPLLPGNTIFEFNNFAELEKLSENVACVIVEPVQGEAGVIPPTIGYLQALREKCSAHGIILIFDEVQTGFGRTGCMFAFQKYSVVPDVLVLAKGMGGGMPIGAFVASRNIMSSFIENPVLGHITTFGGHPVSCAAAYAAFNVIKNEKLIDSVGEKEKLFRDLLQHKQILEIRSSGLIIALQLSSFSVVSRLIKNAFDKGVIIDWFLYNSSCIRLAPPLTISIDEIKKACSVILECLDSET